MPENCVAVVVFLLTPMAIQNHYRSQVLGATGQQGVLG